MSKICTKCGESKVLGEFFSQVRGKDGLHSQCKSCRSDYNKGRREWINECRRNRRKKNPEKVRDSERKQRQENRFVYALKYSRAKAKRYGYLPCNVTVGELETAFTGRCEVCGVPEIECTRRLALDHNHDDGTFRGFLCYNCNHGLGCFKDSEELLINALHFLMNCKV